MVDVTHFVGIALALVATVSVACTNLFVRKGTDGGDVFDAVFVIILLEVVLLSPPVVVAYYPDYSLTKTSLLSFVGAGLVGTLVGQLLHYSSVDRIGASRTAPIVASWALISTVLGVVVLNETVTPLHAVGVILATGGVGAIAWETSQENPQNLPRRKLAVGLAVPLVAAVLYGLEPVLAKVGFQEGTPALVGVVVKTIAAFVGFVAYLWWRNSVPTLSDVPRGRLWWYLLAGLTTTVFVAGYYLSLTFAPVSVIAPIIPANILVIILLSALFMPQRLEHVTRRVATASVIVVFGVVIITVYG